MYSAAKEALAKEKAQPVSDESVKQIREALKPEQLGTLSELVEKLQPMIKAREQEALNKAEIQRDMSTVAVELSNLTNLFSNLAQKIDSLENLKSANAEQERIVLNKLNQIL